MYGGSQQLVQTTQSDLSPVSPQIGRVFFLLPPIPNTTRVIITLIVLAVVAVHGIVMDLRQIKRTRNETYSTNNDRRRILAALLEKEKVDFDPKTAEAVTACVESLGGEPVPSNQVEPWRRDSVGVASIDAFCVDDVEHGIGMYDTGLPDASSSSSSSL